MTDVWVHNLSPFLIEFGSGSGIGIRWYGLSYLLGFSAAFYFINIMIKRGTIRLTQEQAIDLVTYCAIGTMLGGRLGYALFYSQDLLFTVHSQFPYWALLEVHKGGMASHGGIAGIAAGCYLFARKYNFLTTHMIDLVCFGGTLGVGMGRIANFINGELYGRECSPSLSIAVKFPKEIYTWGIGEIDKLKALAPAVESLASYKAAIGVTNFNFSRDKWLDLLTNLSPGWQNDVSMIKAELDEAIMSKSALVIEAIGPALTPRYPSQLIQSFLEGFLIFLILCFIWRKPQKPGVITAYFGVGYSIARIIGEQFRLPDHDIGFQAFGLTRGQWLSIGLLCIMLILLVYVKKRDAKPMGGWSKTQ